MSTTLTLRRGMEYMERRRDEQSKQDKWDYYDREYRRLRDGGQIRPQRSADAYPFLIRRQYRLY